MKTLQKSLMAVAIVAAMSATPVHAAYISGVAGKVVRGMSNAMLGWGELGKNVHNEVTEHGALYIPIGFMKGMAHSVGRSVIGVIELSTFLIPSESLVHPPLVWENLDTETRYGSAAE